MQDRLLRIKLATPMFASVGLFLVTIVFFLKKTLYYVFLILMIKINEKKNTNSLKRNPCLREVMKKPEPEYGLDILLF